MAHIIRGRSRILQRWCRSRLPLHPCSPSSPLLPDNQGQQAVGICRWELLKIQNKGKNSSPILSLPPLPCSKACSLSFSPPLHSLTFYYQWPHWACFLRDAEFLGDEFLPALARMCRHWAFPGQQQQWWVFPASLWAGTGISNLPGPNHCHCQPQQSPGPVQLS